MVTVATEEGVAEAEGGVVEEATIEEEGTCTYYFM